MLNTIELLAPGGDIDSIKAAILAGADAVYCGLDRFNARNRAVNISFDDLQYIIQLAHTHDCRVFLTVNIIIVEQEIPALFKLLNKLHNTSIDGIIVQDLGLFYILSSYFPRINVHASTQLTTHNAGQVLFLERLGVMRLNLSRELNIHEISELTAICHAHHLQSEVFVHGSYCISFSGLCYMSSVHSGNSGNRGRCSQPCRDSYDTTPMGNDFPLNLKDNSAFGDLRALAEAGVDALKIEGRIKKFHYVYTIVDAWRKHLDHFYETNEVSSDNSALYKVFNRNFSNAFLAGEISKDMFIDNPRDHSAIHRSGLEGISTEETLEKAKGDVYHERTALIQSVEDKIKQLSTLNEPFRQVSHEMRANVDVPVLSKNNAQTERANLSILISSCKDLYLCDERHATVYFQLPAHIGNDDEAFMKMFVSHERLIPWFPAILIGDYYNAAIRFLQQLKPKCLVTNNSGIAYEAYRLGIPWIAGPYMNIVNSFSLLCLKEKFHCSGAFISNEMNRLQVKGLKKPENFDLFYSIYHPNLLMTSRQCLFQQVSGCEKNQIEDTCLSHCEKSDSMTNQKGITSFLSKTKGNYHEVYHETHYLNTRIIEDIPGLFSEFLVDLRDIETKTKAEAEKQEIARCFARLIMRTPGSEEELSRMLHPTTCIQYKKGI